MALVDAELAAHRSAKRTLIHGNRQFSHDTHDYPGTQSECARTRLAQQIGRSRGHAGVGQVSMMTSPTLFAVDYTWLHVYARNGLPPRSPCAWTGTTEQSLMHAVGCRSIATHSVGRTGTTHAHVPPSSAVLVHQTGNGSRAVRSCPLAKSRRSLVRSLPTFLVFGARYDEPRSLSTVYRCMRCLCRRLRPLRIRVP